MGVISLDLTKELTLTAVSGDIDENVFKDFLA